MRRCISRKSRRGPGRGNGGSENVGVEAPGGSFSFPSHFSHFPTLPTRPPPSSSDALQFQGEPGGKGRARLFLADGAARISSRPAASSSRGIERSLARQQFIQEHPEAVDVAPSIDVQTGHHSLFRTHVGGSSHELFEGGEERFCP